MALRTVAQQTAVPQVVAGSTPPAGRAGWYNVVGLGLLRWWDGKRWTDHYELLPR